MNSVVSDKGKRGEISLIESTRIMKKVYNGKNVTRRTNCHL